MKRLIVLLLGLLILGGIGYLLGAWAHRWPRIQTALVRLGDAVITMALGLLGLGIVVTVLRALGWLPSP